MPPTDYRSVDAAVAVAPFLFALWHRLKAWWDKRRGVQGHKVYGLK